MSDTPYWKKYTFRPVSPEDGLPEMSYIDAANKRGAHGISVNVFVCCEDGYAAAYFVFETKQWHDAISDKRFEHVVFWLQKTEQP